MRRATSRRGRDRRPASLPNRSATHPPTNTPARSATVPPTIDIEFAISRSSVGHQARHDGDRGREVEAVHREHPQHAGVEQRRRCLVGSNNASSDERRPQPRRDDEDPPAGPAVDEHAGERPEERERQRDHGRRDREPGDRALLVGVEHHRGDERGLEQAVRRLRDEPDREQPPEVPAPQGVARALERSLHERDGRRRRTRRCGWWTFLRRGVRRRAAARTRRACPRPRRARPRARPPSSSAR